MTPKNKTPAKRTAAAKKIPRRKKVTSKKKAVRAKPRLSSANHFKNRILGYELVDPATIKRNPMNWRLHPEQQRASMSDLLGQLGYVDTCLVNKRTGRLIDGEMRLDIAEENNESVVPVLWVDLSPEEERLALATINPMSELANTDPEQLGKLLLGLQPGEGPLADLLNSLEDMAVSGQLKPSQSVSRHSGASVGRTLRIVLSVADVIAIERAVLMTGIANRGEAFMEICSSYLERFENDGTERQHHADAQGQSSDQLAEALAGLTLDT